MEAIVTNGWNANEYPLWHGSVPMSAILNAAGPAEMFVRGEGAWLTDKGGRRFLDGRAGIGNMMLGYSRHDIVEAMHRQALELPFACTMRYERPVPVIVELAQSLVESAPTGLTRVRFTHTGSSAVEAALLMTRQYNRNLGRPQKVGAISLQGSYHGTSLMAMAASGQPGLHELFGPMPQGFYYIPPPSPSNCRVCQDDSAAGGTCTDEFLSTLRELGGDRIAAIIVEPIKGLSGVSLPHHYLKMLREVCNEHNILLIFDEVFSAFGRMGPMFACELSGVSPDIMCVSKGLTAGYASMGAVLVSNHVYSAFDGGGSPYFIHGSSADAHPISCAAALATLQAYHNEDIIRRGQWMGEHLASNLSERLSGCTTVAAVRSSGAFIAIDLVTPDGKRASMDLMRSIQVECQQNGVLIDFTPDILMVAPPLILNGSEVDILANTVAGVIHEFEAQSARTALAGAR